MNVPTHERPDPVVVQVMILTFLENVMLSRRAAADLLGISHSSLVRWADGTTDPYTWTAEPVLKRIELLNTENETNDLYRRLVHMDRHERLEALRQVLQQQHKTPNA